MKAPRKEKVYSTTFIYMCCLDFNPHLQNQILVTQQLTKPFDLPPAGFNDDLG
jgi:hypothetical protein